MDVDNSPSCSSTKMVSTSSADVSLTCTGSSPSASNDSGYSTSECAITPSSAPPPGMVTSLEPPGSSINSPDVGAAIQVVSSEGNSPLAQLMERTGCTIVQQNGQRRYGPPSDWEGPPPPRGTEVFVGKIPRDCFEDELVPLFERAGKIYELRLMMDHHTGQNRGYAFVVYTEVSEAKECVKSLNNVEIRKGRTLGICMSVDNCRLFIGGIPKRVSKSDIIQEMQRVTEGVVDVIVYPSAVDKTKNRGFAFIEYESHRSAAMARRKLMNGRVQLWGHNIAVDWAEPELEVDQEIMAQVKVLYVRNLMLSTSEALIEEAFSQLAPVERVKKIKDYAFVHFTTREDALHAMDVLNGSMLDGAEIEVTLAKPVDKDTYMRSPKYQRQLSPAIYVPIDQYGTILPFYPSYFSSPKYMLRNSMGACTMMRLPRSPSRLPSPGLFPVTLTPPSPRFMYPSSPIRTSPPATLIPTATPASYFEPPRSLCDDSSLQQFPAVLAPPVAVKQKSSVQLLDEICQKNSWGAPIYNLHSTSNQSQGGEDVLFLYKVTISALGTTYMPNKLSRTVDEARTFAADYTLSSLGYPVEGFHMVRPPLQYTEVPPNFVTVQSPTKPASAAWMSGGDLYTPAFVDPSLQATAHQAYSAGPDLYQPGF